MAFADWKVSKLQYFFSLFVVLVEKHAGILSGCLFTEEFFLPDSSFGC